MTAWSPPPSFADQAALPGRLRRLRRVAIATAVPAAAIGALGIIGWASGASTVVFVPRAVTIVPFVAVAVLLMALSLVWLVMAASGRLATLAVRVVAAALLLATILSLLQYATGLPVAFEGRLLWLAQRVVPGLLDAPLMPPLAASCMALLSLALLLFSSGIGRRYAGMLAFVGAIVGALVCLGHAYVAPLLLHNYPRLVALPSGVAFLLLGTATVVAAGPDVLPLRMVAGNSARAILLRRFVPVTIGVLLVTDWVATRLLAGLNPALTSAVSAVLVTFCVAAVVVPLARIVGAQLDRASIDQQQSELHFRDFVEHATIGMYRVTPGGRLLLANPALGRMLGYETVEALAARNLEAAGFEPGRDRREFRAEIERAGEVVGLESDWTRLDGSSVPVRESARVVRDGNGDVLYYEGTVEDLSKRKRAEEGLKASEIRFRALIENSMDLVVVMGADSRFTYSSPSVTRLLGYDPGELRGHDAFGYVHPDDLVRVQAALGRALQGDTAAIRETFRFRHKDGSWRVFESVVTNLLDEPTVAGLVTNSRDVTDRQRAEEALRRSEADFRGLVEHAPLGIYRVTPDGRFLSVNPALITMLGYGWAEEMSRLDIVRDVYADPERHSKPYTEFAQRDEAGTETEWKRKDGSLITVRVRVRTVRDPGGQIECYEGVVEDVTEQRSLENQFRQAQRMEAVGRLAGGVAHDFNNILTAITGYSDLLLEDLGPKDPKRSDVEEIQAAAVRATALTRQLLAFSRKQVLQTRVLDLGEVVGTLEKMLQRLIGEDVKLEVSLAPALGAVRADPGQIEQVILNLAVNSRDAMPNGGRLTIETANVELDEAYAREHAGASPGRYVMVAVSDTGIGMDAETRSHLFEPFFTTKELGKGTGLGLATVYGIVKQSGGYVWVYSEPGHGATFKIYLPKVDELPEELASGAPVEPVAGGRETVLLAEDDPSVRAIVSDVLTQKGYRVLRAPHGQAALEISRGNPAEIRLLVTDLVMPGMTGRELAEALKVERPGLRVLYMSGYTDDTVVRHGVLEEGMPYLQKPFAPRALASKVREVLDRK